MIMLEQLKTTWGSEKNNEPEIQQRIWDRVAKDYGELPIPSFEDNDFLGKLSASIALCRSHRTLDIGCGSGVYSMALAPFVGEAVGVDISPNMIEYATKRSRELGLDNTNFQRIDWSAADIDALGFRGTFDVVFAHMTPAICNYETFDKMNACSRNLCMMQKPTRRKNQVMDEAFRRVGIERSEAQYHGDIWQAFTFLWYKGYCPQFFYHDEVWDSKKSVEDMVAWCTDRALLQKKLTEKEQTVIRSNVESLAVDGMVQEHTITTRVTVIWNVNEKKC